MSVMRMPTLQPAEARLMRWLALAVLLHAGLLLIPAHDGAQHADPRTPLRIALSTTLPAAPERTTATDPRPPPAAIPEPAPTTLQPMVPAPPVAGKPSASDPSPALDTTPLTAARLFDLDGRREWRVDPSAEQRQLGVVTARALPETRRSPERVAIVDRWLAADGSHNVMVETPTGERLCGRAEAWDPLRPLIEPVMMFRSCGSAPGTFVWPERYDAGQRR